MKTSANTNAECVQSLMQHIKTRCRNEGWKYGNFENRLVRGTSTIDMVPWFDNNGYLKLDVNFNGEEFEVTKAIEMSKFVRKIGWL